MRILDYINQKFKEIDDKFKCYVTTDRFSPVEKLAYGFAGLILTGAVVALLALIFK